MDQLIVLKSPTLTLVKRSNASIGAFARKGAPLITLDDTGEQAAIATQQANVNTLIKAMSEFTRVETDNRMRVHKRIREHLTKAVDSAEALVRLTKLRHEAGAGSVFAVFEALSMATGYRQQLIAAQYESTKTARGADQGFRSLTLMLERAHAELAFTRQVIDRLTIKAPVDGYVRWLLLAGAPVSMGGAVVRLQVASG